MVRIPILKAKSLKANAEKKQQSKGQSALWWHYVVSICFRTLFLIKKSFLSRLYYKEILSCWGNAPKKPYFYDNLEELDN